MSFRNVVTDGLSNPPRLRMQYNMWAASHLPRGGEEWTVAQRLDQIAAAGFTGFEAHTNTEAETDELGRMLRDRNLAIGFAAYPTKADDLPPAIELAHRIRADYITAQVMAPLLVSSTEAAETLEEMYDLVNGAGLPFFVETHRGRPTQDLRRTLKIIRRFGKVRFTGDFSHYVIAGELGGEWSAEVWEAFGKIAGRCCNWHGRIGNGEQVQNDIGDGTGPVPQQFKKLWTLGMRHWLKKSQPGDILPFCSELGPPGYSIIDLNGNEISDRWQQSLVIKRLAEEAWIDAKATAADESP